VILKQYKTIKTDAESTLIINKSKFFGRLFCVDNVDDANKRIVEIKKRYHDASHNCFAYIIGKNKESLKYNDDGEPSGTAGIPMLEVLKKSNLTDILAVTTRYFGGIKLGGGGLVRAYSSSVSEAIKNAVIATYFTCEIYSVIVDYDVWSKIEKRVLSANAMVNKIEYFEQIHLEFGLKPQDKVIVFEIFNKALKRNDALNFIREDYICDV
jgi:uncharacterized YigZ family protein